jgi:multiple sugar transport system substrate-binding protein
MANRRITEWFLLLAIVLSGCGRSRNDPNTLLMAVNAGVEAESLKAAVADYQQQKGVKLRVIEYPYQSLFEKLVIALSSNSSSYDLVMIDDPWFPRLAQMEGLQAMAPLFHSKGRTGPDEDFVEASMALGRYPYGTGELYALPYVGNTQLFFYREDLYEKLGIPAPRTWDQVYESGKVIGAREQMYGYVMRAAQGNAIVSDFMPLFWAFGGEMFDENGAPCVNSREGVEALEFMLKLGEIAPPGYVNFNADEVAAHMLQGSALMSINWPAWISAFDDPARSKVVGKIGFLPIPSQKRHGVSAIGNWLLGIPRGSRKASQAFDFLLWVTSREQMRLSALRGNPPTRRSVFEDPELVARFRAYPVQYEALSNARPRPRSPIWNEIENTFGIYLSQANSKYFTAREALDAANRDIDQIVVRWNNSSRNP